MKKNLLIVLAKPVIETHNLWSYIFQLLFHWLLLLWEPLHLLLRYLAEAHPLPNLLGEQVDCVHHKHDWTWSIVNMDGDKIEKRRKE